MPKRLMCVGPDRFEWEDYAETALQGGQVRIGTEHASAKHGTELAMVKGYLQARGPFDSELGLFRPGERSASPYPVSIGNMIVGRVIEIAPDVDTYRVGDRVCAWGGFAETHVVRAERCWSMSEDMPWQSAVCLDPAEFALGAVRDGKVRVGDAVAVFGLGAIGLMVIQLALLAGAYPVIGVDPILGRRSVAAELGAPLALDPEGTDVGMALKQATSHRGVDVAIEYSGALSAMQAALRGVAYGGTVVMGAFPPPYGPGLDLGAEAHLNVPQIVFTRACSQPDRNHPRWDEDRLLRTCWRLLSEGKLTGVPIVSPVVAFGDLDREYPHIFEAPEVYLKLGATV